VFQKNAFQSRIRRLNALRDNESSGVIRGAIDCARCPPPLSLSLSFSHALSQEIFRPNSAEVPRSRDHRFRDIGLFADYRGAGNYETRLESLDPATEFVAESRSRWRSERNECNFHVRGLFRDL